MKILIVTPALGLIYGGPSKSVIELAKAVAAQGVSVDIVTTNANGSDSLDVVFNTWLVEGCFRIQYFPYWNTSDYKISISLAKWLFQNVAHYDLVHTNGIFSLPVLPAYWACQLYQVPYIVTPRGMLEPWALAYKAWKKYFYYAFLEKPALQSSSAIQVLSSSEAENIEPLNLTSPLVIVPNGIDWLDFSTLPDPDYFYQAFPQTRNKILIIFLGRIDIKKGLDLLATAFAQVHTRFPLTHLVIAGPDNSGFLSCAQGYFAAAGCMNFVTFTGMLTGRLKYAALASASVYVAPSYSEGFSMSVLEGMASGLPCVITKGCNFPEAAIAQAAHVVDIDANAIADALNQCLEQPQESREMGDRARRFISENYTWDKIASQVISVYSTIVRKSEFCDFIK